MPGETSEEMKAKFMKEKNFLQVPKWLRVPFGSRKREGDGKELLLIS